MNDIEVLQILRNIHINDTAKGTRLSVVLTHAIEALQEKAEMLNQKPLTLEEIYSMDGEAIWFQWYAGGIKRNTQVLINVIEQSFINCYGDPIAFSIIEDKDAIAYRHKPKEREPSADL